MMMGLWEDMEGVVCFGQVLIRPPVALFLIFQSDAGGAAASPPASPSPSPWHSLFVIWSVFQKHSRRMQRETRQGECPEARVCLLVESGVVVDFLLELCEDIGQGLVVVFHLQVVRAALGGSARPDEGCHAAEDPPEWSLIVGGQDVLVVIDEKEVLQLLLLSPVARLGEAA